MKTCSKCKIEKSLTSFSKRKAAKDGLMGYCKECSSKAYKKFVEENPLKIKQHRKKAYKKFYKQHPGYYDYVNKSPNRKEILDKWKHSWGSGVYGIFSKGKALYIGESTQLRKRIAEHKCWIKNPNSAPKSNTILYSNLQYHPDYVIGILEQTPNHKEREQFYINKLKPIYNE